MADRLFSATNRVDLIACLEAVKGFHATFFCRVVGVEGRFVKVRNDFGIDYQEFA